MKQQSILLSSALLLGVMFSSCSNDDEVGPTVDSSPEVTLGGDPEVANAQNQTEENAISVGELSANIVIDGATKRTGAPPAPAGTLDFQIAADESQEAFQQTGFSIRFTSSSTIRGAYIQFQDVDGNAIDGYYDVPVSYIRNRTASLGKSAPVKKSPLIGARTSEEEREQFIAVDFEKALAPGQFCYSICLYDDAQNISRVETSCVEVEAWGGNAALVGEWLFDRYESSDGEEEDEMSTITCDNGGTVEAKYDKIIRREHLFVLEEDGSYYEIHDSEYQPLNDSTTRADCVASYYESETEKVKYSGFWAYNERAETLTVIDFSYEDLLDTDHNSEYEDGSVYFEGVSAEVVNGELVLTETDVEDGVTYTEKVFFKRK